MLTDSLAPPKEKDGDMPCRCGCAPCDDPCCRLECLVQPRFFCGQLLTDQDLQALVGWTAAKFRLARYRHGWGAVCGLEVRADPKRPTGIIVAPGYAMDCCGNDIVVCDDFRYDLTKYCPDDRCSQPGPRPDAGTPDRSVGRTRARGYDEAAIVDRGTRLDRLLTDAIAVDLAIAYEEHGIEPKVTLSRCGCGSTSTCEHSRTKEGFRLVVSKVAEPGGAVDEAERALRERLEQFAEFAAEISSMRGDVRRRVLAWIDEHPLAELTFVSRLIAQAADSDLMTDRVLFPILYWLFIDYRNGLIRCGCYECTRDTGVPLARIWLDAGDRGAGLRCQVVAIDPRPPYRRPLSPERCRPVPRSCIDLTSVIWTDPSYASQALGAAAERIVERSVTIPESLDELGEAILCARTITLCADRLEMHVVDAGSPFGRRVVSFCPPAGKSKPKGSGKDTAA